MPTWEATDPKTGKTIEFDWLASEPPTDADLDEIFAEAYKQSPQEDTNYLAKGWDLYEKALGLPSKAADAIAGAITSPFMETPLTAGQFAKAVSPMEMGKSVALMIPGMASMEREARAGAERDYPRIMAAADQGEQFTEKLMGDPTTYAPFIGGPRVAMAVAPAILKGAGQADIELAETILREGWSPNAVRRLVDAAGNSVFAMLVVHGMDNGLSPKASVEQAFKATKEKVGKESIGTDLETKFRMAQDQARVGKMPAEPPGGGRYKGRKARDESRELAAELDQLMEAPPEAGKSIEERFQELQEGAPEGDSWLQEMVEASKKGKKGKEEGSIEEDLLVPSWLRKHFPAAEGDTVTLYSGGRSNRYWTTEPQRAASYAEEGVPSKTVTVPREVFEAGQKQAALEGQPTKWDTVLPDEWVKRATDTELSPDVIEYTDTGQSVEDILREMEGQPTPPMADKPVGTDPESGFIRVPTSKDVADFVKGSTDFARASVAGQFGVAARNTISGWRQIIEAGLGNPLAAGIAKAKAGMLRAKGDLRKARAYDEAARNFIEVSKSYPVATWRGVVGTFADALAAGRSGQVKPGGRFGESIQLLRETGNAPLADRMASFSDPTFTGAGKLRKAMMFFSILGDRFVNRTFLDAHVQSLQNLYKKKTIPELLQHLDTDPVAMDFARDSLAEATGEAFRASWQQMSPEKTPTRSLVSYLETKPVGNVIALLTNPFPRALISNLLPNIVEKSPFFFMSKRVKNSYKHFSLRAQRAILKERIAAKKQAGLPVNKADIVALRKTIHEMGVLEKDTIYHPSMIAARAAMGSLVASAFAARRFMSGDDKTEFDELKLPGDRVASLTSQLGEDLPFAYVGDIIGHALLAKATGKPFKYAGKEGVIRIGDLGTALYGSRYGMPTPGLDLAGELASAILGKGGDKDVKVDYLARLTEGVLEGTGRMFGAGAWLGEGARIGAELTTPGENLVRRTDIGPLPEAPLRGFQSQIPIARQGLPESPRWSKLAPGEREFPLASLAGYEQTLSPLEEFMRSNRIDPGDVLPRRSDDPKFDMLYLERFKQLVEKNVLSKIERTETMSQEGRRSWFESVMKKARSGAKKLAEVDYRRQTGQPAPSVAKEKEEKLKKRQLKRESRLPPS